MHIKLSIIDRLFDACKCVCSEIAYDSIAFSGKIFAVAEKVKLMQIVTVFLHIGESDKSFAMEILSREHLLIFLALSPPHSCPDSCHSSL